MKLEAGNTDLSKEENLLDKIISGDLTGYAKLNILFTFGKAFAELNNKERRDYYFNLLRGTHFDVSPVTVSNSYKSAAEIYIASEEKNKSLKWYNEGLLLNPKLAVKKVIKALSTQ